MPIYAPSGEVLGHRGNVAKLNVVALKQHRAARWSLGKKSKVAVVGGSTAFKMIAAHHGACQASLAPQLLD